MEIVLLENHLLEEFPTWKRASVKSLLQILGRTAELSSTQYTPERILGVSDDKPELVRLAALVKRLWHVIQTRLNAKEKDLLMGFLETLDVSVTPHTLHTPKGRYMV